MSCNLNAKPKSLDSEKLINLLEETKYLRKETKRMRNNTCCSTNFKSIVKEGGISNHFTHKQNYLSWYNLCTKIDIRYVILCSDRKS